MAIPTLEKPKRGPGRPKGLGRVPGSGRKPGTPNKDRAATIEKIMRQADPLEFLCKVCRGDRMEAAAKPGDKKKTWWHPTGDQRISAAQTLARKVLPDMKAVEYSGDPPSKITTIERHIVDPRSDAAEAGNAAYEVSTAEDTAKPNGVEPDTESGVEHVNFRDRTRG